MPENQWTDVGLVDELMRTPLQEIQYGKTRIALTYRNGNFSAISGICNHVGGPLGKGRLDGDYVVCPWHYWKFHCETGKGEVGYEQDQVPTYSTKIENGRLYIDLSSATKRKKQPHEPHPLARPVARQPGPVRVIGISTTAMTAEHPRYSTSDALLNVALDYARTALNLEAQLLRLRDLDFRACEGFYSKAAQACTWPCSITQMDPTDQLDRVYEAIVHWAGCDSDLDTHPMGQCQQSLFQDGRADELYPKPRDHCEQTSAQEQGGGLHYYGWARQCAGCGRTAHDLLGRSRLSVSTVPLHRPFTRMECRRHGAKRLRGAEQP